MKIKCWLVQQDEFCGKNHKIRATVITCQYPFLPQGNGGNMATVWDVSGKKSSIHSDCSWLICFGKGQNTKTLLKLTSARTLVFTLDLTSYVFGYF